MRLYCEGFCPCGRPGGEGGAPTPLPVWGGRPVCGTDGLGTGGTVSGRDVPGTGEFGKFGRGETGAPRFAGTFGGAPPGWVPCPAGDAPEAGLCSTRTTRSVPAKTPSPTPAERSGGRTMCGIIAIRISLSVLVLVFVPRTYPSRGTFATPGT